MEFADQLAQAQAMIDGGDYPGAIGATEALIPKLTAALGEHHEDVLHARLLLAHTHNSAEEPERALALAHAVLSDVGEHLGEDHPLAARAQLVIGRGLEVLDRLDQAESWYQRAAGGGETLAMANLGFLRYSAGDTVEAKAWWRRAAEAGHVGAMNNLGFLYEEAGNTGRAEAWYRRAVDRGHVGAMNNLGFLFGQAGQIAEARSWFRRAAEAGHVAAMANLGLLLSGAGEAEAERWLLRAAEEGNTDAMNNLGHHYRRAGDTDRAEAWFRRAAGEQRP